MKKIYLILLSVIIVFNVSCSDSQNVGASGNNFKKIEIDTLSFLRETSAVFKTPESVKYDSENHVLYISNINGLPTEKDGNGFISKMTLDGTILKREWVTGLNAPKGMGIYFNKLYAADIDELVEISISEGKIITKYKAESAVFLNDIEIDNKGNVYVSDTETGKIWILQNGNFNIWLQSDKLINPNGLFFDNNKLLVGIKNKILSVNIKTKEITVLFDNTGSIDGLKSVDGNKYLFSDWSGSVFTIKGGGEKKILLNTAGDKINAADIEYIKENHTLIIPTFYHNTVSFYKLTKKNID